MRRAQRHFRSQYVVNNSLHLALCAYFSATRVARLMYSGHGSNVFTGWGSADCGRMSALVDVGVVVVVRRVVPMISRSIRRCVRCSLVVRSWVVVQLVHPYTTVAVIVESKSCKRDRSGYRLLVNSSLSEWNLSRAVLMRLSISVVW